jgi:Mechanosensitive ion channel
VDAARSGVGLAIEPCYGIGANRVHCMAAGGTPGCAARLQFAPACARNQRQSCGTTGANSGASPAPRRGRCHRDSHYRDHGDDLPNLLHVGESLFASAGLAALVAGFAARTTLSSLLAGVQIALSQPLRLEDAVVVEGEWG